MNANGQKLMSDDGNPEPSAPWGETSDMAHVPARPIMAFGRVRVKEKEAGRRADGLVATSVRRYRRGGSRTAPTRVFGATAKFLWAGRIPRSGAGG